MTETAKQTVLEVLGLDAVTAADLIERAEGAGLARADAQSALDALVAERVIHRSARGMHKVLTGSVVPAARRGTRGASAMGGEDASAGTAAQMDVGGVSVQGLRAYAETLGRITMETSAQHRQFEFWADGEGFHYVPASTGRERVQAYKHVQNVVTRYNQKGSLHPGEYPDLTVNGSYILAIIGKYVHSG